MSLLLTCLLGTVIRSPLSSRGLSPSTPSPPPLRLYEGPSFFCRVRNTKCLIFIFSNLFKKPFLSPILFGSFLSAIPPEKRTQHPPLPGANPLGTTPMKNTQFAKPPPSPSISIFFEPEPLFRVPLNPLFPLFLELSPSPTG